MDTRVTSAAMLAAHLEPHRLLSRMQVYEQPVSQISAIGVHLPEREVNNDDIASFVKAPANIKKNLAKLIHRMTLTDTRRHAEPGNSPSDLAVLAAKDALDKAGMRITDIDTLIFAATDTDVIEPATANIVQRKLGLEHVNAFDVGNACNSFLQAINIANSMIATGAAKKVLITCAEIGSYWASDSIESKADLKLKIGGLTLGDAGTAMIIEGSSGDAGFTEINLLSKGEFWELCHIPNDTEWRQKPDGKIHGWFYLNMSELAKQVRPLTVEYFKQYRSFRKQLYGERDFTDNLMRVIPHQISKKLIQEITAATWASPTLVAINADRLGNTAANAIPLTLADEMAQQRITQGSGEEALLYGAASGLALGHIRVRL